ncbi:MAG: hypothetical protein JXP37_01665, partial [Coriobacteriia bacterium]|nr:hypothetical protein [Coriobacteriia bacterium]
MKPTKKPKPPPAKPLSIEELRKSMPAHMTRNDRRRLKVLLERSLDAAMAERQCGECSACCTALGVHELQKLPLDTCRHVTARGCGIYGNRPPSCREFLCAWRIGIGTDAERPDLLGIV